MDYFEFLLPVTVGILSGAVFTRLIIPALKKLHSEQSIREDGPRSHHAKAGTPTMGGIAVISAVILTCLCTATMSTEMFIILSAFVLFGAIGFIDDYIKVVKKHNLGLRAWQKLTLQGLVGTLLAVYQLSGSVFGTAVYIPVLNEYWDFGIWYVPFVVFVLVAMANSVNLTDGLDGLAAGVTAIVAVFFATLGLTLGFYAGGNFCAALAGACLGFLYFNKNPARIFMGDTGSLALGGGLAAAAIVMNLELLLPIAGFIYVAEALSVIIQVISFKTRGKRVFKMAPLHHHFELSGMPEKRVVTMFWLCTSVFCVIAMYLL